MDDTGHRGSDVPNSNGLQPTSDRLLPHSVFGNKNKRDAPNVDA